MLTDYADYLDTETEPDGLAVFDFHESPERSAGSGPNRRVAVLVSVTAAVLVVVGIAVLVADRNGDGVVTDSDSPSGVVDPVAPPDEGEAVVPTGVVESPGYRWSRVRDEALTGSGEMFSVTAGGAGLVAVGVDWSGEESGAVVWTSVDAMTWSRVSDNEEVFAGVSLAAVTAGGPGLVAVGGDGPHGDGSAAVWTSVDGITWSRVPHDEVVFGGAGEQWMTSVTVGGPGLVAVGWELLGSDADAAVWTSPDGVTWSRVPHDEAVFGGTSYQAIWAVTAGGPGVVAVGGDRSRNFDDGDAAVWTSVDGVTWSRVPHDEAVFGATEVTGVTPGGPGLVAVGSAVLTSADGITWSRVPDIDADLGGGEMASVTAGGPGLVAVGAVDTEVDDRVDAAVWVSADGITWSLVPYDEAIFGGAGMNGVTVTAEQLVTVGYGTSGEDQDSEAAVWVAATQG
jgi:hypothetical protein